MWSVLVLLATVVLHLSAMAQDYIIFDVNLPALGPQANAVVAPLTLDDALYAASLLPSNLTKIISIWPTPTDNHIFANGSAGPVYCAAHSIGALNGMVYKVASQNAGNTFTVASDNTIIQGACHMGDDDFQNTPFYNMY